MLPNTRLLPFQRLFSIPFAAAASHRAQVCACFPLLFCCTSSSSFSSFCSISNNLFIWSGFGIWVLRNFCGFFFGEDLLYNGARFLFFYKKVPAPFQQFVHFLDFFAALLVLFPPLLDEQFHYVFPEHFCSASRGTSNHHGTKPCRDCGELSLCFYLGYLHQLARGLVYSYGTFFSPHPDDALCGWKELCRVWCIGVYLARSWAWCQDCVFCPAAEFGENDFIALHVQDLSHEDWATPEPKDCGHPLCCSFPIRVFVRSISCWFGNYPLHFAPVLCLVLYLRFICEKETAVQDPSKVLQ